MSPVPKTATSCALLPPKWQPLLCLLSSHVHFDLLVNGSGVVLVLPYFKISTTSMTCVTHCLLFDVAIAMLAPAGCLLSTVCDLVGLHNTKYWLAACVLHG